MASMGAALGVGIGLAMVLSRRKVICSNLTAVLSLYDLCGFVFGHTRGDGAKDDEPQSCSAAPPIG